MTIGKENNFLFIIIIVLSIFISTDNISIYRYIQESENTGKGRTFVRKSFLTSFLILVAVSLAVFSVSVANAETLPDPVAFNTDVEAPSFSIIGIDGNVITSENFGSGRYILLVYGRITCYNTRSFLGGIQSEMDQLASAGITVLVGLYDNPSNEAMKEFADTFPGIVCGKVSYDSGMWTGLSAVGFESNSVTFPVVFLRSGAGRFRYYSTGYVYEPLTVVSAALVLGGFKPSAENADLVLPANLTEISSEAFRNGNYHSVYCRESVVSIGQYAFADNSSLEWIYLPSSVTAIDKTAFSGCPDSLIIYGSDGSHAQEYAETERLTFIVK